MTKVVQVQETPADPGFVLDSILVYSKDVAGITQLFAQASDGTVTQLTPYAGNGSIATWGNDSIAPAADTRYLSPGRSTSTASTTDVASIPAPRAGTIRNLFVRHHSATGNGNNVVYTIMINGVATGLTVTLATGAIGQASDLVNTVAVAQGDRISLRATKAANVGGGSLNVQASAEIL
jgi:hypothetical protein